MKGVDLANRTESAIIMVGSYVLHDTILHSIMQEILILHSFQGVVSILYIRE